MFSKILVKDEKTGSTVVKEMYLPVPQYELGEVVGFLSYRQDPAVIYDEGTITGYDIHVLHDPKTGGFFTKIEYTIDDGMFVADEDEIEYSYGIDDKAFEVIPAEQEEQKTQV